MAKNWIDIENIDDGMILASDVCDEYGRLIIAEGTIINREYINKIQSYNIERLPIELTKKQEEELKIKLEKQRNNPALSYYERLSKSEEFAKFEEAFHESVGDLRNNLNDIVNKNADIEVDKMLSSVNKIIESNTSGINMFDMLNCMRSFDDLTYVHSMNVALICNVFGKWLSMNKYECDTLTMCGVLHDIGKLKIPKAIILKPGKLTEEEYRIIKGHPVLGYKIIENSKINSQIKYAALQHHERFDGKGYPMGVNGEKISKYARIVAIADVYDAMTANRVYRRGLCPFTVIEHFEKGLNMYDPQYILTFLHKTADSYINNKVLLSNGEQAKIVMINKNVISRPVVIVGNRPIDLSKNLSISIKQIL